MNRSLLRFAALGVVGLSLGLPLLATGCAGEDPQPGPEWDSEVGTASLYLQAVGSCGEVEQAVRDAAYEEMKQSLYAEMMQWLARNRWEIDVERARRMVKGVVGGDQFQPRITTVEPFGRQRRRQPRDTCGGNCDCHEQPFPMA